MRRLHQPVPQRRGRKSDFLGPTDEIDRIPLAGRRARLAELASSDGARARLAATCRALVLADADSARAGKPMSLSPNDLSHLDPLIMREVRRPANPKGRTNLHRLMTVRPLDGHNYQVHMESENERSVARQLLIGRPDRLLVTQAFRLEWGDSSLRLRHTPDLLFWDKRARLLVDVTSPGGRSRSRKDACWLDVPGGTVLVPLDQLLQWELSALVCDQIGWSFEVRTDLTRQASLNLATFAQWTDTPDAQVVSLAEAMVRWLPPDGCSLHRLLNSFLGPIAPWDAAKHLVQNGRLHLDWLQEIRATSWIHPLWRPLELGNLVSRSAWTEALARGAESQTA